MALRERELTELTHHSGAESTEVRIFSRQGEAVDDWSETRRTRRLCGLISEETRILSREGAEALRDGPEPVIFQRNSPRSARSSRS
jgi:hypothetical protein